MNGVVTDLARHPAVDYAVVWRGLLLPIRFTRKREAYEHLESMKRGEVQPPVEQEAAA